ncbi:MAG: GspH/FimT family pseudopilin [Thermodesulfobacteriota bacterium]
MAKQLNIREEYTDNYGNRILTDKGGFSLMEMVIVLGIISIMAAIAIPSFLDWLPRYRLKSAARDLYSNMQKARIGAIKSNKDWAIVFDAAANKYHLCSDKGSDGSWSGVGDNTVERTVDLDDYQSNIQYGHGKAAQSATSPPGAFPGDDISYNSNVTTFNPVGTGSSGYVYLENSENTAYTVGSQSSGVITLKIWDGSSWE